MKRINDLIKEANTLAEVTKKLLDRMSRDGNITDGFSDALHALIRYNTVRACGEPLIFESNPMRVPSMHGVMLPEETARLLQGEIPSLVDVLKGALSVACYKYARDHSITAPMRNDLLSRIPAEYRHKVFKSRDPDAELLTQASRYIEYQESLRESPKKGETASNTPLSPIQTDWCLLKGPNTDTPEIR